MNNLARKNDLTSAMDEHGLVIARDRNRYVVQTENGRLIADQAVGCLVEPQPEDLVLLSIGREGQAYIISVLKREHPVRTTLSFEEDVLIRSEQGRISLSAKEGLDLVGEGEVGLMTPQFNVAAEKGDLHIGKLSVFGSLLQGKFNIVKMIAESLETFCDRVTGVAKQSYRHVEETEQVQCGRLFYQADSVMQLKGEFTKLHADEDVHVSGERINIG